MAPKTKNMILFCRIRSPLYIFIKLEISHLLQIRLYFSHWLLKSIFQKLLFNFICRGKIKLFAVFMCFHQKSKMFFLLQQNIGIILPFLFGHSDEAFYTILTTVKAQKSWNLLKPVRNIPSFLEFVLIRLFQTIGFFPGIVKMTRLRYSTNLGHAYKIKTFLL